MVEMRHKFVEMRLQKREAGERRGEIAEVEIFWIDVWLGLERLHSIKVLDVTTGTWSFKLSLDGFCSFEKEIVTSVEDVK